jgi:hypothetical protein
MFKKMKIKNLLVIGLGLISSTVAFGQETEKVDTLSQLDQRSTLLEDALASSKKLKISGYIQSEWQSSQIDDNNSVSKDMKVGAGINQNEKDGAYVHKDDQPQTPQTMNRFGVRRGRLKATYTDNGCTGVVYIDATEKGVVLKEAYATALDPFAGVATLKAGVFNRPFGYEIEYSSSSRYSPERSRIIQTLFPSERDLGATLILQAPKTSPWSALKLEVGLLGGNAINVDTKSQKDFIGHLTFNKVIGNDMKLGLGASIYDGFVYQGTKNVYRMSDTAFVLNNAGTNVGNLAPRSYIGLDGQFSIKSVLGLSNIRAEYIFGTQPNGDSPNANAVPAVDTYIRHIAGGYINLEHDIADTKFSIVAKYDWYDPNTEIAGNMIGLTQKKNIGSGVKATDKTDIAYSTLGLGVLYRMNQNVKLTVYYDRVMNETSNNLPQTYNADMTVKGTDFTKVLAANLLTVRLQYKF